MKIRQTSLITCIICEQTCYAMGISHHLKHKHDITSNQYYNTYLKKETEGMCYACNKSTKFVSIILGYRKFCNIKCVQNLRKICLITNIYCQCDECNTIIYKKKDLIQRCAYLKPNKYAFGHHAKIDANRKIQSRAMSKRILENNGKNPVDKKHKHGKFYSKKNKKKIYYQSSWELLAYKLLEQMSHVKSYQRCDFSIQYIFENRQRLYHPDIFVEYTCDQNEILEIKTIWQSKDLKTKAKFKAARKYAKQNNLKFTVWTEKELFNV